MRRPTLVLALLLASSLPSLGEDGFRPLFNGRDLSGWVVVNTAPSTWKFDGNGTLICSGKPIGEIRTERMYQNFILELEWRHLVPKGNAGVFVWADDITARGQPFIRGIEIQVLENAYGNTERYTTHGDIFPIHGATMTPSNGRGGMRSFPTEKRSHPAPEWNHYRIECRDGTVILSVNGKEVNRGTNCIPRKGYLCLESEGGEVEYRNVRLKELPDTPIDPDHIAIADRGFRCLYTGVDFLGWKVFQGWVSKDWEMHARDGAAPLITEERFEGNISFLVDFLLEENSFPPALLVRGRQVPLPLPKKTRKEHWIRYEVFVEGSSAKLEMDGKPVSVTEHIPATGPVGIVPFTESTWANPYVRSLD